MATWDDFVRFRTQPREPLRVSSAPQLGMAGTWDLGLAEQVARVTAVEVAATGVHWTFSPVLCIARDLRWGRVSETFGEDSYLIGELAAAMVRGYQGKGLTDQTAILATANTRTDRRADRVAGGPGRHRNPPDRGAAGIQTARPAAGGDGGSRAHLGSEPWDGGRPGDRGAAAGVDRTVRPVADLVPAACRSAAHLLQPDSWAARPPVRRSDPGACLRIWRRPVVHPS